jgi:glycosyltransferase involved in cell wall biosynthesis
LFKKLSVIIPALNEGSSLEFMIPNMRNTIGLNADEYEIIVINSGGTDTTSLVNLPMVHIYQATMRLGAPQARNLGADVSSGENLVFADAHLKFEQDWGSKVLNNMELNPNLAADLSGTLSTLNPAYHDG